MRDKNRITLFLGLLGEYWAKYCPDWRFGQLICNMQKYFGNDLFYVEEEEMIDYLNNFFGEFGKE